MGTPEWDYCAQLARGSVTKGVTLNQLHVNVQYMDESSTKCSTTILQMFTDSEANYTASSVVRFQLSKLKRHFLGSDASSYCLYFQAYDGADKIKIQDDNAFWRLLAAIKSLGLPIKEPKAFSDIYYLPPILHFLAVSEGGVNDTLPMGDTTFNNLSPGRAALQLCHGKVGKRRLNEQDKQGGTTKHLKAFQSTCTIPLCDKNKCNHIRNIY